MLELISVGSMQLIELQWNELSLTWMKWCMCIYYEPMKGYLSFRVAEPDPSHTLEERVVHWYFSQLDKNSSGDIGKKEIKPFKRFLRKKSKPKKCVKKFVEYCDISNDKALSLQELMGCLGVTKEEGELNNRMSTFTKSAGLAYWCAFDDTIVKW